VYQQSYVALMITTYCASYFFRRMIQNVQLPSLTRYHSWS